MSEISNEESLAAWLEKAPFEVAGALTVRTALRVAPLLVRALDDEEELRRSKLILPAFRALAAAHTAIQFPLGSPEVADAARAAGSAANFAAQEAPEVASANALEAAGAAAFARYVPTAAPAGLRSALTAEIETQGYGRGYGLSYGAAHDAIRTAHLRDVDRAQTDLSARLDPMLVSGNFQRRSLWFPSAPDWARRAWEQSKRHLLNSDEGWEIWIDWYEDRLAGRPEPEALALARATIPDKDWKNGPGHVNAIVRRLIEEHAPTTNRTAAVAPSAPELPEPRPAPVAFEFRDGALRKATVPLSDLPGDRERIARQAWQALDALVSDLLTADPGRNSPRLARVLAACRTALGTAYDELAVVALGVHAARLQGFAARADQFLMPEDAAELIALNAQLGLFLGQFPDWADYARGISGGFGTPQAEAQAVADGVAAIDSIEAAAPGIIAPDAKTELAALADAATPDPSADGPADATPLSRRSFLRSLRSGLVALAGSALVSVRAGARKGIEKHVESTVAGALSGAQTYLFALAAGLPGEFGWLAGVVTYLTRMIGPSRQADTRTDDDIASA